MKLNIKNIPKTLTVEIYVKKINPDDYILVEQKKLLPSWHLSPQILIIFLFRCQVSLDGTNEKIEEREKDRFLTIFNNLSMATYKQSNTRNILLEAISPKDGFPLHSQKGSQFFSLPLIVSRYLSTVKRVHNSCGLSHQQWGRAVYPCLMVSPHSIRDIAPIYSLLSFPNPLC